MKNMLSMLLSISVLLSLSSCSKERSKETKVQYNRWTHVEMEDGLLEYGRGGLASVFDYETMQSAVICNIPNCNHMTTQCLAGALASDQQLPVIYNNCAYYFSNYWGHITNDEGKRAFDLKATIFKYDFNKMEISTVTQIEGYNANEDDGSFLIGNKYYFTTNNADPEYDDIGNVTGGSSGGQAKLYCINLDTEELIDYGEVFEDIPNTGKSIRTRIVGFNENKLYFSVSRVSGSKVSEEIISFNMDGHEFEKVRNGFLCCVGEGYLVHYSADGSFSEKDLYNCSEYKLWIENIETGELTEGPVLNNMNDVAIFNNKLWYDSKCFDINTKQEAVITELQGACAEAVYKNCYIVGGLKMLSDTEAEIVYEKIPCEEIDSLFE